MANKELTKILNPKRFFTYLVSYVHCNLKSCMAKVIMKRLWLFTHGPSCLTHECNIGPDNRQKAILARARSAWANIAFWRSPRANIALRS